MMQFLQILSPGLLAVGFSAAILAPCFLIKYLAKSALHRAGRQLRHHPS